MPARHTCPALSNWFTACFTAASRSVSAKIRNGALPPSSRETGVRFAPADAATSLPVGHRTGERDPSHVGMRDERGARLLADPLHDVEGAVGHPGVAGDVGQERGRERRPLRRLRDDGIPGGERRRDPPRGEHQRRVPRRDHDGDAGGIPAHVVRVTACVEVLELIELVEMVREEVEVVARRAGSPSSSSSEGASRCRASRLGRSPARAPRSAPRPDGGSRRAASRSIEPQVSKPFFAASTAALASSTPPRATSAIGSSSIGETSVKVEPDADPFPADPMLGRDLDALDLDAPAQCRPPRDSFVPERYGRPANIVKPSSRRILTLRSLCENDEP